MKIFKITFKEYDYDEYDALVVRAENEEEVKKISRSYSRFIDWKGGFSIEEIEQDGEPEVILGSFNAG